MSYLALITTYMKRGNRSSMHHRTSLCSERLASAFSSLNVSWITRSLSPGVKVVLHTGQKSLLHEVQCYHNNNNNIIIIYFNHFNQYCPFDSLFSSCIQTLRTHLICCRVSTAETKQASLLLDTICNERKISSRRQHKSCQPRKNPQQF